jgi:hypothetical protein
MNEVTQAISKLLPTQINKSDIKYRENLNMLTTVVHNDLAGNLYFKGIRLSDRIIVIYDIGIGYLHPFLNGLTIYAYKNKEIKKIVSKSYSCRIYKEAFNRALVKKLLIDELLLEIKNAGIKGSEPYIFDFAESLVKGIYKKQVETLKSIQFNSNLLM